MFSVENKQTEPSPFIILDSISAAEHYHLNQTSPRIVFNYYGVHGDGDNYCVCVRGGWRGGSCLINYYVLYIFLQIDIFVVTTLGVSNSSNV